MSRLTTGFHFCALFTTTCPYKSKSFIDQPAMTTLVLKTTIYRGTCQCSTQFSLFLNHPLKTKPFRFQGGYLGIQQGILHFMSLLQNNGFLCGYEIIRQFIMN